MSDTTSDTTKEGAGVKLPEPDGLGCIKLPGYGELLPITGGWVALRPDFTTVRDKAGDTQRFSTPEEAAAALCYGPPASPEPPPPASDARPGPEGLSKPDGDGHWLLKPDGGMAMALTIYRTLDGSQYIHGPGCHRVDEIAQPGDRWFRLSPTPSSPPASPTAVETGGECKGNHAAEAGECRIHSHGDGGGCVWEQSIGRIRELIAPLDNHSDGYTAYRVEKVLAALAAERDRLQAQVADLTGKWEGCAESAVEWERKANESRTRADAAEKEVARLSAENSKLKADLNGEAMIRKTGVRHMKELMERRDSLEDALRGARADVTRLSAELEAARKEAEQWKAESYKSLDDNGRFAAELSREREARKEAERQRDRIGVLCDDAERELARAGYDMGSFGARVDQAVNELLGLRSREEETPKGPHAAPWSARADELYARDGSMYSVLVAWEEWFDRQVEERLPEGCPSIRDTLDHQSWIYLFLAFDELFPRAASPVGEGKGGGRG